jgi:GWxTD domain-containing protein
MSRRGLALGFVMAAALLCLQVKNLSAQNQSSKSPDEKSRKIKREDNRAFRDWPRTDVKLIITSEEEAAYDKLKTVEERGNFITHFWQRRDPSPDTEENEYKDEYYERIAYANEHFSSGKPGWLTDRGRIYVKWGKPSSIESHPAGGPYQRSSYDGGSTATYPFETWFYRYLPGVGSGIEIEFVDPSGSGEYRLARNPFEKEAGVNGPRPEALGIGDPNSITEKNLPFSMMSTLVDLEKAPPIEARSSGPGSSHRPVEDTNLLVFEVKPYYFLQADGNAITAFTIQTSNRELVFQDSGGLQTARMNVFGKVWSVTDRKLGAFEETLTTTATTEELAEAKDRQSVYGKAVILPPGKYRLDVLVRDVNSGATGFQQHAFTVPRLEETKLQISSIVLAAKLESTRDRPGVNQFTIGRTKVVPNISGIYHRGAPLGVYLQVYNAAIDQTTLRPSVDVVYVLLKDGQELSKQSEDWVGMSEAGQRLTLARLLETSSLVPGQYNLEIRIRDHVTGQTLTPTTRFTVVD